MHCNTNNFSNPEFNDSFDDLFSDIYDLKKIKYNNINFSEDINKPTDVTLRITRSSSKRLNNQIILNTRSLPLLRRKRKSSGTELTTKTLASENSHDAKSLNNINISDEQNIVDTEALDNITISDQLKIVETNNIIKTVNCLNESNQIDINKHNDNLKNCFSKVNSLKHHIDNKFNIINKNSSNIPTIQNNDNIVLNCNKENITDYITNKPSNESHILEIFFNQSISCDTNNISMNTKSDEPLEKAHIEKLEKPNLLNDSSNSSPAQIYLNTPTSNSSIESNCLNTEPKMNKSSKYLNSLSNRIKEVLKSNCRKSNLVKSTDDFGTNNINQVKDDTFYGLPIKVKKLFEKYRKIGKLYDWQEECLKLDADYNGGNLIYTLPTSGGKTLVAEIIILRQLLVKSKDVLFIMPFVAIVQEKMRNLSFFASELGFAIEEYAASKGSFPPRQRRCKCTLYVATIEKAAGLINSLIGLKRINELGLVVVDELHMLGEKGGRGAILETLLALLITTTTQCQVVGMSATLKNIDELCQFLNAKLYTNDFRPVQLCEYIKMDNDLFAIDKRNNIEMEEKVKFHRSIQFHYTKEMNQLDKDQIAGLVLEVVPHNSCLVFCPTKKNCENVAQLICKFMPNDIREFKANERKQVLDLLKESTEMGIICPILKLTIPWGVAFHHGGLTNDERKIIEEAYSQGVLSCLTCTSTLAAGVNLPAKRVILRSPYVGLSFISCTQYKQMAGRAGRAGIDDSGESIMLLENKDKFKFLSLLTSSFENCLSTLLHDDAKSFKSLILSAVGLQVVKGIEDLMKLLKCTLCWQQRHVLNIDFEAEAKKHIAHLIEANLIEQQHHPTLNDICTILEATNIGRAVYKGSICISIYRRLHEDLLEGLKSLVVNNPLHLLYLITPYDSVHQININWNIFLKEVTSLSMDEQLVANIVKVPESYIHRQVAGQPSRNKVDETRVKRFYLSLMLLRVWKQDNVWLVASKFEITRGFLQQLISSASAFATCVHHYTQELEEFWAYRDLFVNFVKRLSFSSCLQLIPLLEIPGIKTGRAMQLYKAGYKDISHLSRANPTDLVNNIDHMNKKLAKEIINFAKLMLAERAEALIEEADLLINT